MAKILCMEPPNERPYYYEWPLKVNDGPISNLDRVDIERLEEGSTVWKGDIAFSLAEDEERYLDDSIIY